MENQIKIGLIIAFILCLFDMPYGYFQLVRFTGMIGFGILAAGEKEKGNQTMFIIFALSAILINPIIKIPLGRTVWNVIDVIWAILLGLSLENDKQK
jgi:hypothetical protein